jgi:hypothetical protein
MFVEDTLEEEVGIVIQLSGAVWRYFQPGGTVEVGNTHTHPSDGESCRDYEINKDTDSIMASSLRTLCRGER